MNKILQLSVFVSLFFFGRVCSAQITMDATYNPYVNDNYNYKVVTDTTLQPGATGAAVNWNFTGIILSVNGSAEAFVNPSSTPFASSFPTANLAVNDLVNGYDFFSTSSSGIEFKGKQTSIGGSLILSVTNSQHVITYPFTYGSSVTNPVVTGTDNFGDTLSGTITSVADGWGILALPSASYTNVVRVKTVYDLVALFGPGTETYYTMTQYAWYGSVSKLPLMKIISYDVNHGTTYHTKIVRVGNFLTTGIADVERGLGGLNVFPNPVQTHAMLTFSLREKSDVMCSVFDQKGKLVYEKCFNGLDVGMHSQRFDASDLPKGIYFLLLNSNGIIREKKIIID